MRVLLFGALADLAGWRERPVDPPEPTLSALRRRLAETDAALGAALLGPGVQTAVNQALVRHDPVLEPGAEVAFLPPMSGG